MISREISVLINEIQVNESGKILLYPAYSVSMSWILTQQCLNLTHYAEMSICWTLPILFSVVVIRHEYYCTVHSEHCLASVESSTYLLFYSGILACAGGDPFQGKETTTVELSKTISILNVENGKFLLSTVDSRFGYSYLYVLSKRFHL